MERSYSTEERYKAQRNRRRRKRRRVLEIIGILLILFFGVRAIPAANRSASGDQQAVRYKYYTSCQISYGDTLWDISKEFISDEYKDMNAYMVEVRSINHLESDHLKAGTTIIVPYYSDELK